ncbi:MAG: hypothetical protein DMF74_11705 [Acidobacteria bacterium]|nr:MAG: hypothetical protein DMF74_11705 [Acidobacteriota bacterium]
MSFKALRTILTTKLTLGLVLTINSAAVLAQQPASASAPPAQFGDAIPTPSPKVAADDRYRIGAGDVLDIKVLNKPQFNREGVRVSPRGMIRMPLIKDEIRAACRSEEELEIEITAQLKEYVREPQVTVQIQQYQSEPVAVLGSVRAPSRFLLQRRVRLLELLTFVNGPTDNAGRTIQIVHTEPPMACQASSAASGTSTDQIDYYVLKDTFRGEEKSNPYVRPGDVVYIAAADQAFVIGNVVHPTSIALTEPVTVSRAIAMAGGTAVDTKKNEIHIIRQTPGTTEKKEILVDLEAVNRHKAEDIILVANDVVEVPASGGKRFFRSLVGAALPSIGSLPIRAIP